MRQRAAVVAGVALALACAWFVGARLADEWPAAEAALEDASPAWAVAGVVLAAAGMTAIAAAWRAVLASLGHQRPLPAVVAWYYAGEIGKYLPGGVWPIVGRAELARRGGVSRSASYSSVALSLGLLYLACALVACALLPFALDEANGPLAAVLVVPPLGLVALHPAVTRRVVALGERALRRPLVLRVPSFGESIGLVARYLPVWLLIGGATWSLARALDPAASVPRVVLATAVSWLAGFLAVPVPGGVGVREAVFVAVAGLPAGVGASVAVVARVTFVAVDAAGALLSARRAPQRPSSTGSAAAPGPR